MILENTRTNVLVYYKQKGFDRQYKLSWGNVVGIYSNFAPTWREVDVTIMLSGTSCQVGTKFLSFFPVTKLQSRNEVPYHIRASGNVSQFETHFTSITN